ncbi:MAG TPA: hypothetical protein VFR35_01000 [Actinoplanes sp.]|nr:hypothetical protein [Actinoplanes sp.]
MTYPSRPATGRHQFPPEEGTGPTGYRPGSYPRYDAAGSADTWWEPRRSGTPQPASAPPNARPEPGGWQPPRQPTSPEGQGGWRSYAEEHAWEQPAPYQQVPLPQQPSEHRESEPLDPMIRGQIAERMIRMNTSHALAAADRLGSKTAIGPHSLALFSVEFSPGRYVRLSTATRLVLDGEDADSLPELLGDLTSRAYEKIAEAREQNRRWDPRTPLTGLVLRSEEVTENTTYVGLGVSTLDTPEVPWSRTKLRITGADGLHLRGQGYIYLGDGTAIHIVRRAQMAAGHHEITANRRVDSQYQSRRADYLTDRAEQQGERIWDLLRDLHEVLMTA